LSAGGVESEVKLRIPGPDVARAELEALGARLVRHRHLEDNALFDDEARSLATSGRIVRLRRTPHAAYLTFKGPRRVTGGIKVRPEHETTVGDPEAVLRLLEGLGLRQVFRYQKYREVWELEGAEVVVDETPVGAFLEIEGTPEAIHAVAARLHRGPSEFVVESYVSLFFAAGGRGDMLFPEAGKE
jgi:adenylate cyclase class 2